MIQSLYFTGRGNTQYQQPAVLIGVRESRYAFSNLISEAPKVGGRNGAIGSGTTCFLAVEMLTFERTISCRCQEGPVRFWIIEDRLGLWNSHTLALTCRVNERLTI